MVEWSDKLKLKYTPDLEKIKKVMPKHFPIGIYPHLPQEICFLDLCDGELPKDRKEKLTAKPLRKLNRRCANCIFSGMSQYSRQAVELGIGGWMSNQKEGLRPEQKNPIRGIDLREPHTSIVERGVRWVCHNPKAGSEGIYILDEETPGCTHFIAKEAEQIEKEFKK